MGVQLTIYNSQFSYGKADQGGAIYISGESSSITMVGIKFIENKAAVSGGAIYASSFQEIIICNNTWFKDNNALFGAGDIYAELTNFTFLINDTLIQNSVAVRFQNYINLLGSIYCDGFGGLLCKEPYNIE